MKFPISIQSCSRFCFLVHSPNASESLLQLSSVNDIPPIMLANSSEPMLWSVTSARVRRIYNGESMGRLRPALYGAHPLVSTVTRARAELFAHTVRHTGGTFRQMPGDHELTDEDGGNDQGEHDVAGLHSF